MSSNPIAVVISTLISSRLAATEEIRGCSPEEIREVETVCGVQLPRIYRDFLMMAGKGAGAFLAGSDAFYPDLLHIRRYAEQLLREDSSSFHLSEDAFVYLMHQGYQFMFFHTSDSEVDPPIFHYIEGSMSPSLHSPSFSEFLFGALRDYTGTSIDRSYTVPS